ANPAGRPNPAPVIVPPPISKELMNVFVWLYLIGDPAFTSNDLLGGFLTWLKAISLLCFVGWVVSWVGIGIKERVVGRGQWYDYVGVAALVLTPVTVMLRVLESLNRIPIYSVQSMRVTFLTALLCVLLYAIWIEVAVGRTIRRLGRPIDMA